MEKQISKKTRKRIEEFEGNLRMLAFEAYAIAGDLADEGFQEDGMFAGEARKYSYMDHYLTKWVEDWFGGYK